MMKNLTMFILFTITEIVFSTIFIVLAVLIKFILYIGIIGSIIITIIYFCLIFWSPSISPFYTLQFDNNGIRVFYFKKVWKQIDWNEISNISYEFHGKIGYYIFYYKTEKPPIAFVYE